MAPFLEEHGITVLGLRSEEPVPPAVRVLVGGPESDPRCVPLRGDREATLLAIYAALDERPTARGGYRRVVFGVDPGQVIGLAVVADGAWLHVCEVRDIDAAVDRVVAWTTGLSSKAWDVHVGNGDPQVGRPLLAALRRSLPQARVVLVGEEKTSPYRPITASRHTDAAILIALREPAV